LKTPPELPATTLADYCYEAMFIYCDSLTTAPVLPATTLTISCYYMMFQGCTELTTAPLLPAKTLAKTCYQRMFNGCSKLNNIKVNFTAWNEAENSTQNWVEGVSATGTFTCPAGLDTTLKDASHVPVGWTVDITTGINTPVVDKNQLDPKGIMYNLSGQRVDENYKGIVIQNGKKYLKKH
jgi:hypothetical protein